MWEDSCRRDKLTAYRTPGLYHWTVDSTVHSEMGRQNLFSLGNCARKPEKS